MTSRVLMTMVIGGLVFGSARGHAADGRENLVAYAGDTGGDTVRRAPAPRTAQGPTPPTAPLPPKPPRPPKTGGGISVSVNGQKIDVSFIDAMVRGQIDGVREMIRTNPNIPPPMRAKLLARLDKVKASVEKRLAKIKTKGLAHVGEELEGLGEEIEQSLEGLEEELEQMGDQLGKNLTKQLKNKQFKLDFDHDDDDDNADDDVPDAIPMTPDLGDSDSEDMRDALEHMKGMAIKPAQKDAIAKIRAKSDADVTTARKQLDELSHKLEGALENPQTGDAEIARYVDQISAQEAAIRKARILAWVNARRVLDETQRKRIEAAAAKKKSR